MIEPRDRRLMGRLSRASPDVVLVSVLMSAVAVAASWRLSVPSLWIDEGSTWAISGHGLSELVRALRLSEADAGGLYLVIQHFWLVLWGSSVIALRSLSVICAIASVPLLFLVARRLVDHAAAVIATALFALSPFLLQYARDARMYTFALALSLAASYFFVRMIDDGRVRSTVWYVVMTSAAIYAHAFCLLVVATHLVSLCVRPRPLRHRRQVIFAFGGVVLATVPLLAYVALTDAQGVGWVKPLGFAELQGLSVRLTGATSGFAIAFIGLVVATAVVLAVVTLRRHGRCDASWRVMLPILWFVVPIAFVAMVSLYKPFFVPRYLFVVLPGYVLTLGMLITLLLRRAQWQGVVALIGVVVLAVPAVDGIWGSGTTLENWHAAESYVAAHYRRGDAIVVPVGHAHAFGYYAANDPRLAKVHPTWTMPYGMWTISYRPAHYDRRAHTALTAALRRARPLWVIVRRSESAALTQRWQSTFIDRLRHRMYRNRQNIVAMHNFNGVVVYEFFATRGSTAPASRATPADPQLNAS